MYNKQPLASGEVGSGDAIFGLIPLGAAVNGVRAGAGALVAQFAERRLPVVVFSEARVPGIAANISRAQTAGAPRVLTRVEADVLRENRNLALRGQPKAGAGLSWDEYPFASTAEGGSGSYLSAVPIAEQNYQGGLLSSFYQSTVPVGARFVVRVGP